MGINKNRIGVKIYSMEEKMLPQGRGNDPKKGRPFKSVCDAFRIRE